VNIAKRERPRFDCAEWHWKFAWLPTRTSPTHVVWLGWYQRRMHVVSEGNWAGGFQCRWHYARPGGLWEGPLRTD
jgi:hypothetical protein